MNWVPAEKGIGVVYVPELDTESKAVSGSWTTKGEEELTGRRRKVIGNDISLPVKSMVKFEHCEADGGNEVTNDACARQMMDARIKMAVSIQLGMTGRMIVVYICRWILELCGGLEP